jgi:class 3 adenylate cyclase
MCRIASLKLQVDISGFTKLSEHFSSMGTEGSEKFGTLVSKFLSTMCEIIERHHGDIDCFADDALLIVFSEASARKSSLYLKARDSGSDVEDCMMRSSVELALNCVTDICVQLNGLTISPNSPSLKIHGALAAGALFALECGRKIRTILLI